MLDWRSVVHLRFAGSSIECWLLPILRPFSVGSTKKVSCAPFATRQGIKDLTPTLLQSCSSLSFTYFPPLSHYPLVLARTLAQICCLPAATLSGRDFAVKGIFYFLVSTPLFRGGFMTVAYNPWGLWHGTACPNWCKSGGWVSRLPTVLFPNPGIHWTCLRFPLDSPTSYSMSRARASATKKHTI